MKRITKSILALSLGLGMVGCGSNDSPKEEVKPVIKEEKASKELNLNIVNNNILSATWLNYNVDKNVSFEIEITNNHSETIYVGLDEEAVTNHTNGYQIGVVNQSGLAPGESCTLPVTLYEEDMDLDIDCITIQIVASFFEAGKSGDDEYIGAFCLLPKEEITIPFDADECTHNHGHNDQKVFENDKVELYYITKDDYGKPIVSLMSKSKEPINWYLFIMECTDEEGNQLSVFGNTELYLSCDNGIHYMPLFGDIQDKTGTFNFKAMTDDGEIEFSITID